MLVRDSDIVTSSTCFLCERVVKGGSDHISREEKQPFHISQVKNE